MPPLGPETPDRHANRVLTGERRVGEMHASGGVDAREQRGVVSRQRGLVAAQRGRHVPQTDEREWRRREAFKLWLRVDP